MVGGDLSLGVSSGRQRNSKVGRLVDCMSGMYLNHPGDYIFCSMNWLHIKVDDIVQL